MSATSRGENEVHVIGSAKDFVVAVLMVLPQLVVLHTNLELHAHILNRAAHLPYPHVRQTE